MKLCIITPAFNAATFLPSLYASIVKVTTILTIDLTWILIDDGSTDETLTWARATQRNESVKMIVHTKANGGKHTAINAALDLLGPELTCIVDADDLIDPDELNRCLDTGGKLFFARKRIEGCERENRHIKFLTDDTPISAYYRERVELVPFFMNEPGVPRMPVFESESRFPELFWFESLREHFGCCAFVGDVFPLNCKYYSEGLTATFKSALLANPFGFRLHYRYVLRRMPILHIYWPLVFGRWLQMELICYIHTTVNRPERRND